MSPEVECQMNRLRPFEKLDDDDYYVGGGFRDDDSGDEISSDDELQEELRKLAGIKKCDKKKEVRSDFENDMEDQLDNSICDYAEEHMGGKLSPKKAVKSHVPMEEAEGCEPSSSKMETDDGEEENPIRRMSKKVEKDVEKEAVDFYDPAEDDDNEKWVAERNSQAKGGNVTVNAKGKIDNDSDAVLSCPGCMNLLTRDCQRHEIYKDQYRAMFVENCVVDKAEKMTIEKTGKEKRRQRQSLKKQGLPPTSGATDADVFVPVRCQTCNTKVAVMDNDEVYHFFNVLSGYA